jgi:uncharacterized protein (TIGR02246 family)
MKTYYALVLLIAVPYSPIVSRVPKIPNERRDPQAQAAVAQGYRRWVAATQRKDVEAVVALYADDAIVLPPGGEPVAGREHIRKFYETYYADPFQLLSEDFSSTSLVLCGDLAVNTAVYSGQIERGEKGRIHFMGKNLVIWKQDKRGSWKIFRDMWSSSTLP